MHLQATLDVGVGSTMENRMELLENMMKLEVSVTERECMW